MATSLQEDIPETRASQKYLLTPPAGVHILYRLLIDDCITKVYCLIRAPDDHRAFARIHKALEDHCLLNRINDDLMCKISAYSCDYTTCDLGLQPRTFDLFRSTVTHIIHNAWSVNFNQSLRSFETGCISSLKALLDLAASTSQAQKPSFTFVSSIATALRAPGPVPEDLVPWEYVEPMGYAQSKWVAEQIAAAASNKAQIPVRIARLGQICGDTLSGIWNPAEAIPLTIRTALTLGVLPSFDGDDEELHWLPADVAAQVLVELALDTQKDGSPLLQVSNVVNEAKLLWTGQFLPWLKRAGLKFEAVSGTEWVTRLEAAQESGKQNSEQHACHLSGVCPSSHSNIHE